MKEEILRAIETIKQRKMCEFCQLSDNDEECMKQEDCKVIPYDILKQGYNLALTALQELFDRLDGCEYCTGDVDERFYFIDYGMQLYIDGNNALTLQDTSGDFVDTHINNCPNCGRKLRGGEDE